MTASPGDPGGPPLIVFDGECILCSRSMEFVMARDKHGLFRLTTAQSAAGRAVYAAHGLDATAMTTMIVAIDGVAQTESDAVLAIIRRLGWPWRVAGIARIIPRAWRDLAYRWLARNRYRLIGRRDRCWTPDASVRDRIV